MDVKEIEKFLLDNIAIHIDSKKIKNNEAKRKKISKSLIVLALAEKTGLEFKGAALKVTDDYDDNGIDGFYLDNVKKKFWIIQAKSSQSGKKGVSKGDIHNFIDGVGKILNRDFEGFNKKIKERKEEILSALDSTEIKFKLLFINLGDEIAQKTEEPIKSFLEKQNVIDEEVWIDFEGLNKKDIDEIITQYKLSKDIKLEISLSHWGLNETPFKSYYGTISASIVGEWFKKYGSFLFSKNIRNFLGSGEVNSKIISTLETAPQHFYYLNNGITIICDEVKKTRDFGSEKHAGNFKCKGVQIINGAQTVGSIGYVYKENSDILNLAKVMIKIISLKNAAKNFINTVTVATNSQNKIAPMDFVSMDETQIRLEKEVLRNHNRRYLRLRSELADSEKENIITPESAAAALCCCNENVYYSTMYKREKNKIWENIQSYYYKKIFPKDLSTHFLINSLEIIKFVEEFISKKSKNKKSRELLFCRTGNRFLTHLFYDNLEKSLKGKIKTEIILSEIKQKRHTLERIYNITWYILKKEDHYKSAQLSRLFISLKRIQILKDEISIKLNRPIMTRRKVKKSATSRKKV